MAFRNRLTRRVLFTGAATAVAVGASVGVALAVAITFTISPGGAIKATAGTTTLTDTKTGSVLTCKTSNSTATLKKGHGISGTNLGSISNLTFNTCTGPLSLSFTVTNSGFPWKLTGSSYNSGTGTTTGNINGIKSSLVGGPCSLTVGGTTATSTGKVKLTYTNSSGKLKVLTTGGNLHVWNVSSGCAGLINTGDPTTFSGTYTVSPKQTITSP
jgi:hypothetical protein